MTRACRAVFLLLVAALPGWGCAAWPGNVRLAPVSSEAQAALEEAEDCLRSGAPEARASARAALEHALALAPDWITPARRLQDLEREQLQGPSALGRAAARLAADPQDGAALYLLGRLSGLAGAAALLEAQQLAPEQAWCWHGAAAQLERMGRASQARLFEQRAMARARSLEEANEFALAQARQWEQADEYKRATALLVERLELTPEQHSSWCELAVALSQLELRQSALAPRGFQRCLQLLGGSAPLTQSEAWSLLLAALQWDRSASKKLQLLGALDARPPWPGMRALLGVSPALLELLEPPPSASAAGPAAERGQASASTRAREFGLDHAAQAFETWRAQQPSLVLDDSGGPRDARLQRLAQAIGALAVPASTEQRQAVGEALLQAGWFEEAQAFAETMVAADQGAARSLAQRAIRARALLAALVDSALELEQPGPSERLDLRAWLATLDQRLDEPRRQLGWPDDQLARSPLLEIGPFARVVQPGPLWLASNRDAPAGAAGQPVPGLAALLDRLGRFGIFGEALGQGAPDGALLQRVWVGPKRGAHLGWPFEGTVAICEGAELEARAARSGGRITGAALHEGYWLNLDALRAERAEWQATAARYFAPGAASAAPQLQGALAERGPLCSQLAYGAAAVDRALPQPLLGAAQRLRLTLLQERAGQAPELDCFVELTSAHEEGHLLERARFLPLSRGWLAALRLFVGVGCDPRKLLEAFEYRAQLTAACVAEDPRYALESILSAAEAFENEGSDGASTVHAQAYAQLARDLLEEFGRAFETKPGDFPDIDGQRYLCWQWQFLEPEALRSLALGLARRKHLLRE